MFRNFLMTGLLALTTCTAPAHAQVGELPPITSCTRGLVPLNIIHDKLTNAYEEKVFLTSTFGRGMFTLVIYVNTETGNSTFVRITNATSLACALSSGVDTAIFQPEMPVGKPEGSDL